MKNEKIIRGNTTGNIVGGRAFVAKQDEWLYFRGDGDYLYKMREDCSDIQQLNDDFTFYINVLGDWVYYNGKTKQNEWKLHRIRLDGTDKQALCDDDASSLNVIKTQDGEWIYYCGPKCNLYKIRTDGTEREKLNDDSCACLNVTGDAEDLWIYYRVSIGDWDYKGDDNYNIYKIRTDGSQRQKLNDEESHFINVENGWIYFKNAKENGNLYKMRTDGTQKQKLNDDNCMFINAEGDWIYYQNYDKYSSQRSLFRMRTDGSDRECLDNVFADEINVIGEWIYYRYAFDRFRIHKDGSDGLNKRQALNSVNRFVIPMVRESIKRTENDLRSWNGEIK